MRWRMWFAFVAAFSTLGAETIDTNPGARSPWAWIAVLLFFAIPGGFGGVLYLVLPYAAARGRDPFAEPASQPTASQAGAGKPDPLPFPTLWEFVIGVLGGVGGSVAGLFVMLLDHKVVEGPGPLDCLLYICVGMIAGFLGFRLLQPIAINLLRVMQQQTRAAEKIREESQQTGRQVSEQAKEVQLAELKGKAREALDLAVKNRNFASIPTAILRIQEARHEFPEDYELGIYLARLYRWAGERPKLQPADRDKKYLDAIRILDEYVEAIRKDPKHRPHDEATFLYNRACYHLRRMEVTADAAEKDRLRQKALADLKAAIALDPENYDFAENDGDLDSLLGTPEFAALKPTTT
jgi:hypothetical protein